MRASIASLLLSAAALAFTLSTPDRSEARWYGSGYRGYPAYYGGYGYGGYPAYYGGYGGGGYRGYYSPGFSNSYYYGAPSYGYSAGYGAPYAGYYGRPALYSSYASPTYSYPATRYSYYGW